VNLRPNVSGLRAKFTELRTLPDRTPLRVQLVLVLLALVMVGLALSAVAGTTALRGYLLARVDDQLQDTARGAMRSGQLPGNLEGSGPPDRSLNQPALTGGFFSEVTDASGTGKGFLRVPTDSSQSGPRLPLLTLDKVEELSGEPFTVDAESAGYDWRMLVTALPDGSGALVVGTSLTDVRNTVGRLMVIQLFVSVIILALLGLAGYAIVRSSLRKLVAVEQTAAAIAGGDLSRRVDAGDERTEVGRLGSALNTMLGTIETSFAAQKASEEEARESESRMRRFVGDASHELRTPLTSIRGFAELQRQQSELPTNERNRLNARIEAEATRMGLLVEDLLLLARLDQQRPLEQQPVEVAEVVRDAVQDSNVLAPEHEVELEARVPDSDTVVLGDRSRLRQIVSNLLSNAYVHTPARTHVRVELTAGDDIVRVTVADDGPGMNEEDAARVFERFFRSDPSRTRASGGSGLGLSIVSSLVSAHGGTISLVTSPGNGAAFAVVFPRVRFENESDETGETDVESHENGL
jgi:two-component system OmpR family sensor kinase